MVSTDLLIKKLAYSSEDGIINLGVEPLNFDLTNLQFEPDFGIILGKLFTSQKYFSIDTFTLILCCFLEQHPSQVSFWPMLLGTLEGDTADECFSGILEYPLSPDIKDVLVSYLIEKVKVESFYFKYFKEAVRSKSYLLKFEKFKDLVNYINDNKNEKDKLGRLKDFYEANDLKVRSVVDLVRQLDIDPSFFISKLYDQESFWYTLLRQGNIDFLIKNITLLAQNGFLDKDTAFSKDLISKLTNPNITTNLDSYTIDYATANYLNGQDENQNTWTKNVGIMFGLYSLQKIAKANLRERPYLNGVDVYLDGSKSALIRACGWMPAIYAIIHQATDLKLNNPDTEFFQVSSTIKPFEFNSTDTLNEVEDKFTDKNSAFNNEALLESISSRNKDCVILSDAQFNCKSQVAYDLLADQKELRIVMCNIADHNFPSIPTSEWSWVINGRGTELTKLLKVIFS